jgi:hypothetical protein
MEEKEHHRTKVVTVLRKKTSKSTFNELLNIEEAEGFW